MKKVELYDDGRLFIQENIGIKLNNKVPVKELDMTHDLKDFEEIKLKPDKKTFDKLFDKLKKKV